MDGGGMSGVREMNLVHRAIRERWPIPKAKRRTLVRQLIHTAATSEDARTVVAAVRALLEADKQNMEQEPRDRAGERLHLPVTGDRHPMLPQIVQNIVVAVRDIGPGLPSLPSWRKRARSSNANSSKGGPPRAPACPKKNMLHRPQHVRYLGITGRCRRLQDAPP